MADTQRTLAYLLANIFQDGQAASSITAQDIRDLIVSIREPRGKQYFAGNVTATTIAVAGTDVKAAGTTIGTLSAAIDMDSTTTSNRLIYTGVEDRHFHIISNVSLFTTGSNQECSAQLYLNGVVMPDTESHAVMSGSGELVTMTCHGDIHMSTNDYVEIWVANETSTNNVTVQDLYMFAMGMLV